MSAAYTTPQLLAIAVVADFKPTTPHDLWQEGLDYADNQQDLHLFETDTHVFVRWSEHRDTKLPPHTRQSVVHVDVFAYDEMCDGNMISFTITTDVYG